jgi:hypothetical protein
MGADVPIPASESARAVDGPPGDDRAPCLLLLRPREFPDPTAPGVGPFHTHAFPSEGDRVTFVTHWQHDFEMRLPD